MKTNKMITSVLIGSIVMASATTAFAKPTKTQITTTTTTVTTTTESKESDSIIDSLVNSGKVKDDNIGKVEVGNNQYQENKYVDDKEYIAIIDGFRFEGRSLIQKTLSLAGSKSVTIELKVYGVTYVGKEAIDKAFEKDFKVTSSSWATDNIIKANKINLFKDTNLKKSTVFTKNISREDFVEIVMNYVKINITDYNLELIKAKNPVASYKDTKNKLVLEASQLGIVSGVSEDQFMPNRALSREEVSVILSRTENLISGKIPAISTQKQLNKFKDEAKISNWARQGVAELVSTNVIAGKDDGKFAPQESTTQEQAVTLLMKCFKNKEKQIKAIDFLTEK